MNKKTNLQKQAFYLGLSFVVFFMLLKIGISFFSKGGYQPMIEELFANEQWKKTLLTVLLGGTIYGFISYFLQKRKIEKIEKNR